MMECFSDIRLHVPFASHVGAISGFGHEVRPEFALFGLAFFPMSMPQVPPGHEHVTAGLTDCSIPRSRVVNVGEGGAGLKKFVKMGSLHFGMPKGSDCRMRHVISEDEEDIWFFSLAEACKSNRKKNE